MKEAAAKIQAVINTLEGLNITATYENMNRLLGSIQTLIEVRDELTEVNDGNADAD